MTEQKFKVGDGIKVLDLTGIIVNERKIEDNSIEYLVRVEGNTGGSMYTWVSQSSLKSRITDEQKTILEGLYLLGYRYLACDKNFSISDSLWVYTTIPYKNDLEKWDSYDGNYLCVDNIISPNILNNLCSWEDEKPTSIAWLLGKKDKNE